MKKLLILSLMLIGIIGCTTTKSDDSNDSVKEEETSKDTVVSFIGVGDNLIHERMLEVADENAGAVNDGQYDFTPFYSELTSYFNEADLSYVNQETILGGDELGASGYPVFNTPSVMANNLHDLGVDVINTASNHSLDKGYQGIVNSVATWRQFSDMIAVGVNDSEEDQNTIKTITKNGITFAVLSYTYGTNGIVAPNSYCVNYFDEDTIRADVAKAKEISDAVIVLAHWGDEYSFTPNSMQNSYAQLFADLEVDLVVGCHVHVIQPMEYVTGANGNKTLVIYGLGNMISGMLEKECQLGGMVSLDFVKNSEGNITVENVKWIPLVNHYEGDANNIMETRTNFKSYPLSKYTDELAATHGLNGYEGITITRDYFINLTQQVIGDNFTIEY